MEDSAFVPELRGGWKSECEGPWAASGLGIGIEPGLPGAQDGGSISHLSPLQAEGARLARELDQQPV